MGLPWSSPEAGLKSVFHILDTYGDNRVEIPVFTGMTGFFAVSRDYGMDNAVNRRAIYGSTLPWRLLKQALETRHYGSAYFQRNDNFSCSGGPFWTPSKNLG